MEVCLSILTAIIVYLVAELIKFLVKKLYIYNIERKEKKLQNALNYLLEHEKELLNELLKK